MLFKTAEKGKGGEKKKRNILKDVKRYVEICCRGVRRRRGQDKIRQDKISLVIRVCVWKIAAVISLAGWLVGKDGRKEYRDNTFEKEEEEEMK